MYQKSIRSKSTRLIRDLAFEAKEPQSAWSVSGMPGMPSFSLFHTRLLLMLSIEEYTFSLTVASIGNIDNHGIECCDRLVRADSLSCPESPKSSICSSLLLPTSKKNNGFMFEAQCLNDTLTLEAWLHLKASTWIWCIAAGSAPLACVVNKCFSSEQQNSGPLFVTKNS